MKRKITGMLLVAAMMGTAVGCSSGSAPETTAQTTESTTEQTTEESQEQETEVEESTETEEGSGDSAMSLSGMPEDEMVAHVNHKTEDESAPIVYFTSDVSPEGLRKVYEALGHTLEGNVAVKISTGEQGNENYLRPELIGDLVQSLDGTIVECNTAYDRARASTAMHYQVAEDHGFTEIAEVDIMDEEGSMEIPVEGGTYLTEDLVGDHLANYDSMLALSHFKGHPMGGFGGALKNISIGVASRSGKSWIHSAGTVKDGLEMWPQNPFLCSMAEAAWAVDNYFGDQISYVNVLNNISVDCDCVAEAADPAMEDIGIMASLDPVAIDSASVDMIYDAHDGHELVERIESLNGLLILEHGEEMGLGSQNYRLVNLDE